MRGIAQNIKENKMTTEQMVTLGIVASVITFLLRVGATYLNLYPGRLVVNLILYVVSGGLAFVWLSPTLPPFTEDIAGWISALVQLAAPVVGLATLVYNALYSQVVVPAFSKLAKK